MSSRTGRPVFEPALKWRRTAPGCYDGIGAKGNAIVCVRRQASGGRWAILGHGARTFLTLEAAKQTAERLARQR